MLIERKSLKSGNLAQRIVEALYESDESVFAFNDSDEIYLISCDADGTEFFVLRVCGNGFRPEKRFCVESQEELEEEIEMFVVDKEIRLFIDSSNVRIII